MPLVLLAAAVSCARGAPVDPVILSLGDEAVRLSDFERHLAGLRTQGLDGDAPGVRRAVLDSFIEERVLVLEARRRGLVKAGAAPEDEAAAAQSLVAEAVGQKPPPSEAEISAYYAEHKADLSLKERVTLRQILVPTENEARDVRRLLAKQPRSFAVLAQTRSHSPEASAGGLMGTFGRGELPEELEPVAFSLAPGSISDAVKTPLGYHVLKVDAREPARERSLDECRPEIERLVFEAHAASAARDLVRGLLSGAKVNYDVASNKSP
jgi:peptidyl-prolyl cis-trans isomerase C